LSGASPGAAPGGPGRHPAIKLCPTDGTILGSIQKETLAGRLQKAWK
jgi:hypothetical protein